MTVGSLINYVKSLSHEEIDQDLDSAIVVAAINRGIRMLDDLHPRSGTFVARAYTLIYEARQVMQKGMLTVDLEGANALTMIHDIPVTLKFTWASEGEEKTAVRTIEDNTVYLPDITGDGVHAVRVELTAGTLFAFLALYSPFYENRSMIPELSLGRFVYHASAYTDDFLSFQNIPPVTSYGYEIKDYFYSDDSAVIPDTWNADILFEYRKKPVEISIEDLEENSETVSVDVAEDVVMMLPYLVTHDLFLDDNSDVAIRCYNIWETERARYLTERANRRTLFTRHTYKGW